MSDYDTIREALESLDEDASGMNAKALAALARLEAENARLREALREIELGKYEGMALSPGIVPFPVMKRLSRRGMRVIAHRALGEEA